MVTGLLLGALLLSPSCVQKQEESNPDIAGLIRSLESDEVSLRNSAQEKLKSLPYAAVADLRERLDSVRDAEAKVRLTSVIRHLLIKESDELYKANKVRESLLKRAEAQGAEHPSEFVLEQAAKVRRYLQEVFSRPEGVERAQYDMTQIASRVRSFGPYAIPVLIELSAGEDKLSRRALTILHEYPDPDEILPPLIEALSGTNEQIKIVSCLLLGQFKRQSTVEPLLRVYRDNNSGEALRKAALESIMAITRKKPD